MKIILSRKGFDSKYGGQPSPILPDGTLLSLPIPIDDEPTSFSDITFQGKTYYEIIKELKPTSAITPNKGCHLDPDIRDNIRNRPVKNWKPIFGQAEAAQGHLQNNGIGIGDIFLYFGWFRETEMKSGRLAYKKNNLGVHLIYGYLQIGGIHTSNFPDHALHHTHTYDKHIKMNNNCIYVASDYLSLNNRLSGAGCFNYKPGLVLTMDNKSRSKWKLPDFFKNIGITYHSVNSFKNGYFQSAAIGQEFIIKSDDVRLKEWLLEIFK